MDFITPEGTSGPKQIAYLMMSRKIGRTWTSIEVGLNFGTTQMRDCNSVPTAIGVLCTWTSLTRRRLEGVCPRVHHEYDAEQSMVTGNQVTDLLREIPHDPTKMYYEPKHSLYLAVHVEVMDIIETQLADNDGSLVDFASGVTTLTLHFKYE